MSFTPKCEVSLSQDAWASDSVKPRTTDADPRSKPKAPTSRHSRPHEYNEHHFTDHELIMKVNNEIPPVEITMSDRVRRAISYAT